MSVIATYTRLSQDALGSLERGFGWLESLEEDPVPEAETVDIDKACDGIIWLLERLPAQTPSSTTGAGFVLLESFAARLRGAGGSMDHGLDAPYGPASVLSPVQTIQLSHWLSTIDTESIAALYDPRLMDSDKVYPQIWTQEGDAALREYLLPCFAALRDFFGRAAAAEQCVIVYFT